MTTHIELNGIEYYVEYKVYPAETMRMYDRNGEGHPGTPEELELLSICVNDGKFIEAELTSEQEDEIEQMIWGMI